MKQLSALFLLLLMVSTTALADAPKLKKKEGAIKVFAAVYKSATDCDITYYRIKVNGEDLLVDSEGRFIKYICETENHAPLLPAIYKVVMIPVSMMTGLQ